MKVRHMLIVAAAAALLGLPARSLAAERSFRVAAIEYQGTKIWVPGTLIVRRGDHVKVTLINDIPDGPAEHGWAVPAFDIATVVKRGEPTQVEFTASKDGIFEINCHLHPTHIGGQLLVLP